MIFLYSIEAGNSSITLSGEEHRYLFKVRREGVGSTVLIRDLRHPTEYSYHIAHIDKKSAKLKLVEKRELVTPLIDIHICWAIIEPKNIEKALPFLNELGVSKLTLFYAARSQKIFKPNPQRIEKILINSSQQCGRAVLPNVEILNSTSEVLESYSDVIMIDFSDKKLDLSSHRGSFMVGPEGGFDESERDMIGEQRIYGLKCPNVLKSESAVVALTSLISLV